MDIVKSVCWNAVTQLRKAVNSWKTLLTQEVDNSFAPSVAARQAKASLQYISPLCSYSSLQSFTE